MTTTAAEAQAVQLVRQDGAGGLAACPEGLDALRQVTGQVKVVCIAGMYRSGKSLLLNRLARWMGQRAGFQVGNSTESCTRGIWMSVLHEQGVILLDTEGLASVDQDETYDCKIFTLGLLLSSYFVYNSMGVIDEAAVDRLYMVGKLAQSVSKTNKVAFSLLWLLRDFSLTLDQFGNDPNAYFEDALQDKKKRQSNQQRQEIRRIFRNRECRTLVRPAMDERQLQNLDALDDASLRPEFRAQIQDAFQLIQAKTGPKKLAGQPISGDMLAMLLEQSLTAINGGAVPDIKKTFEYIAEESYRGIAKRAEAAYLEAMRAAPVTEWVDCLRAHEAARAASAQLFFDPAALDTAAKSAFLEQLQARLHELLLEQVWPRLSAASAASVAAFATDRWLPALDASPAAAAAEMDLAAAEVAQLGPDRHAALASTLLRDVVRARLVPALTAADERAATLESDLARATQEATDLRAQLAETAEAMHAERLAGARLGEQLSARQAELEAELRATAAARKQLEAAEARVAALEGDLRAEREAHEGTRAAAATKADELIAQANEVGRMQQQVGKEREAREQAERDSSMLREELQEIVRDVAAQQSEFDQLQANAERQAADQEVRLVVTELVAEVELVTLRADKKRVTEERAALHSKLQDFHLRASTLPEFYQSQVFCTPTGLSLW